MCKFAILKATNRLPYRTAASSSSKGRFVVPITSNRSSFELVSPSRHEKNSVLSLLDASCSEDFLADKSESTSSTLNREMSLN